MLTSPDDCHSRFYTEWDVPSLLGPLRLAGAILAVLLMVGTTPGCRQQKRAKKSTPQAVDTTAVRAALADLHQSLTDAIESGETSTLARFPTTDARLALPGRAPVHGLDSIKTVLHDSLSAPATLSTTPIEREVVGPHSAREVGTVRITPDSRRSGRTSPVRLWYVLQAEQTQTEWKVRSVLVGRSDSSPTPRPWYQRTEIMYSPFDDAAGRFGQAISVLGKYDGVGFGPAVIVGAPQVSLDEGYSAGGVAFNNHSGPELQLTSMNSERAGRFGTAVAGMRKEPKVGERLLVGAPGETVGDLSEAGRAYLFNLDAPYVKTAARTFEPPRPESHGHFGEAVAGLGADINGDEITDVAIGAPEHSADGARWAGRVYVFSGAPDTDSGGEPLRILASPTPRRSGHFGQVLAPAGDVNGDGTGDVLVGAPGELVNDADGAGRVYLFSGTDGQRLRTLRSPTPEFMGHFGRAVAVEHRDTANPTRALLVGAPGESRAYEFGTDGTHRRTFAPPDSAPFSEFGASVEWAGDVNGDGMNDILVGAPNGAVRGQLGIGMAYVLSGANGHLLQTLTPPPKAETSDFGRAAAVIRDADGNDPSQLVIGGSHGEKIFRYRVTGRESTDE